MPKLKNRLPNYRKHKASGQAVVTLNGVDHYLGKHGSEQSRRSYDRLTGEWLAAGRTSPDRRPTRCLKVHELVNMYWKHVKSFYLKPDGTPSETAENLKPSLRLLRQSYGDVGVDDFGPIALKALQDLFVQKGNSRRYVNENIGRIRRAFRWGVSEELVEERTYRRLLTVEGLRRGKTNAPDRPKVEPIDDTVVVATLTGLQPTVRDMVRIQRLTGARPSEVCIMRPMDIDQSDSIWVYTPHQHKTEHHEKDRVIVIGPNAQSILKTYLNREEHSYCFNPQEVITEQRRQRHAQRVTPLSCGCKPHPHARQGRRPAGQRYTTTSYRRAIHRACDRTFLPPTRLRQRDGESKRQWTNRLTTLEHKELKAWQSQHRWSPNQLRHTMGTKTRERFGIEAVTLDRLAAA